MKTESLESAIYQDVCSHLSDIEGSIYGYALLPWDMSTQPAPPTMGAAFNRESDIKPQNIKDDYYRYSVDEWANWEHKKFQLTNDALASCYKDFESKHSKDPDDYCFDDQEIAFLEELYDCHLSALTRLRDDDIFSPDTYKVIWISDSFSDVMDRSAEALNCDEIYSRFLSQFG